jgi:hypothetical protein
MGGEVFVWCCGGNPGGCGVKGSGGQRDPERGGRRILWSSAALGIVVVVVMMVGSRRENATDGVVDSVGW